MTAIGTELHSGEKVGAELAFLTNSDPSTTPLWLIEHLTEELARRYNAHAELVEALTRYVVAEEMAAPYSSSPLREYARAALGSKP